MTQEEFRAILDGLEPGESADVPYEVYEEVFPPGEPDQDARERAYNFAEAAGVLIDNRVDVRVVRFYRNAQRS